MNFSVISLAFWSMKFLQLLIAQPISSYWVLPWVSPIKKTKWLSQRLCFERILDGLIFPKFLVTLSWGKGVVDCLLYFSSYLLASFVFHFREGNAHDLCLHLIISLLIDLTKWACIWRTVLEEVDSTLIMSKLEARSFWNVCDQIK